MDGPQTIGELYAYIMDTDDGAETVPVVQVPEWDGQPGPIMVPLIGANIASAHALRRVILSSPELEGKTLRLKKFTAGEVVEVLKR